MRTRFAETGRRFAARTLSRLVTLRDDDRGDVPGWVMVTLMSAALVAVIFVIAQDRLTTILGDALDAVLPGE